MTKPSQVARPLQRFTFHVGFLAADGEIAQRQAEQYACGLLQLRAEVDCYTARVSSDSDWAGSAAVFCGKLGPDATDICTDSAGHPGWHSGPGASRRWSDGDVPTVPDIVDGD